MSQDNSENKIEPQLIENILQILLDNGLKATTMDDVASSLKMSKRTLYEIFGSKANMVELALTALHRKLVEANERILTDSCNVIEAILKGFLNLRNMMGMINAKFFRDLDELYPAERENCKSSKIKYLDNFVNLLNDGVGQGLFRKEINFMIYCRMMMIQMESLKRMEQLFPQDISLLEVYDSICMGFLRGIATTRGHEILDELFPLLFAKSSQSQSWNP